MSDISASEFVLHHKLTNDCIEIADLPLSKVLLMNDNQFPWFILVPKIANISEIYELEWEQQQQLLNESSMLSELLMEMFSGDKLNVAALGNIVSQLHVHHVVRFKTDIAWPNPVWGAFTAVPYSDIELIEIKEKAQSLFKIVLSQSK